MVEPPSIAPLEIAVQPANVGAFTPLFLWAMLTIITSPATTPVGLLICKDAFVEVPLVDVPRCKICPKAVLLRIKFATNANTKRKVNFFMLESFMVKIINPKPLGFRGLGTVYQQDWKL